MNFLRNRFKSNKYEEIKQYDHKENMIQSKVILLKERLQNECKKHIGYQILRESAGWRCDLKEKMIYIRFDLVTYKINMSTIDESMQYCERFLNSRLEKLLWYRIVLKYYESLGVIPDNLLDKIETFLLIN